MDKYLMKLRLDINSMTYRNVDLQLKMGMAALISYYRRKAGLKDFSRSDNDDWLLFFKQIEEWVTRKRFDKKREAKSRFRYCRTLMKRKEYLKALRILFDCLKIDPMFFLYKGINLNVPKDFNNF